MPIHQSSRSVSLPLAKPPDYRLTSPFDLRVAESAPVSVSVPCVNIPGQRDQTR